MAIRQRGFLPRLLPKIPSDRQGVDLQVLPPGYFIAGLMQLPVMVATKGHGELVAHFKTEGSGLRKPQVMRIARLPATDQTRLRGDEPQMGFVTQPFGLGDGEKALVDWPWHKAGRDRDNHRAAG